ncbi:MAG: hypothetical protein JKX84_09820 [Flavobacteriales bacterium]|nr:hypothetical protein [Flavobacteriales bacterium]
MSDLPTSKTWLLLGGMIETDVKSQIKLAEGFVLKKANIDQQNMIRQFLASHVGNFASIAKRKWTHWLVECDGLQQNRDMETALLLSKVHALVLARFEYAPEFGFNSPTPIWQGLRMANFLHSNIARKMPVLRFDRFAVQEVNEIHQLLAHFDKEVFPFISKAIGDFLYSTDISETSPFRLLSYFTIIEQLLTTDNSRRKDFKSLRSQIKTKVNLVNNQLSEPIVPSDYLKVPNTDTIETLVDKLYTYRNDIAHGNRPDFEGKLSVIKRNDREAVLVFVRVITQTILKYALKKPELVRDLKAC